MHILEILLIMRECSSYKCNISVNISNIQSQSHLPSPWFPPFRSVHSIRSVGRPVRGSVGGRVRRLGGLFGPQHVHFDRPRVAVLERDFTNLHILKEFESSAIKQNLDCNHL